MTKPIKSTARVGRPSAEFTQEVDLALAVMCTVATPGERYSYKTIAEVTGMSHGGPYVIEKRALKKLRQRLRYTTHRETGKELRC